MTVTRALAGRLFGLAFAVCLATGSVTAALAHAHLDHAVPASGETVRTAPTQIEIFLSEAVEPAFSSIEVFDQTGDRVDRDKASVDPEDPKALTIALRPLTPGTYKVVWSVVSVDTHKIKGSFSFTVAP